MNILIPCFGGLEPLPPAISLIDVLLGQGHSVSVITMFEEKYEKNNLFVNDRLTIEHVIEKRMNYNKIKNVRVREIAKKIDEIRRKILLRKTFKLINRKINSEDSMLWILHESTLNYLGKGLKKYKYVVTTYELDKHFLNNKNILSLVKHAYNVVVPEYNRAHIIRGLLGLTSLPFVLPNKPSYHPLKRNIKIDDVKIAQKIEEIKQKNKKIILYLGIFAPSRKLDTYINAYKDSDKFELVLMGKPNQYLEELLNKYPKAFTYLGYLSAPEHLSVVSHADVGILTYIPEKNSINSAFCAPNKIFEYGGFGIPCLCNDIPGLQCVKNYHSGIIIDINNSDDILNNTQKLFDNYEYYSLGIKEYFDFFNVDDIVSEIISSYQ